MDKVTLIQFEKHHLYNAFWKVTVTLFRRVTSEKKLLLCWKTSSLECLLKSNSYYFQKSNFWKEVTSVLKNISTWIFFIPFLLVSLEIMRAYLVWSRQGVWGWWKGGCPPSRGVGECLAALPLCPCRDKHLPTFIYLF